MSVALSTLGIISPHAVLSCRVNQTVKAACGCIYVFSMPRSLKMLKSVCLWLHPVEKVKNRKTFQAHHISPQIRPDPQIEQPFHQLLYVDMLLENWGNCGALSNFEMLL